MTTAGKVRLAALILCGLLALLVCALVLVHTPPVKRYALRKAEELLRARGIDFTASKLDYNLLKLTASLDNVVVRSAGVPDLPPLVKVQRIYVNVSLGRLIHGTYAIEDALLRRPELHIVIDPQGRDNIPKPARKQEGGETDYLIAHLEASGGSFTLEDRQKNLSVLLPLWHLTITGQPDSVHNVRFETKQPGKAALEQRALPIQRLSLEALLKKTAVDLKNLALATDSSQIVVQGAVTDFAKPVIQTEVTGRLGLASLAQFAGIREKVAGDLNVRISAAGALSELKVSSEIRGQKLSFDQFQDIALFTRSIYDLKAARVEISTLDIQSPVASVSGTGSVAVTTEAGTSSVDATIGRLDLYRLTKMVASVASGTVTASWPGLAFEKAQGNASLQLGATPAPPSEKVLPVSGSLAAQARDRWISIQMNAVEVLSTRSEGAITLDPARNLAGEIRSEVQDLGVLAKFFGTGEPEVKGEATLIAKLGGSLERPRIDTSISAPAVQVGQLHDLGVYVDGTYSPEQVVLRSATVTWQGQTASAQGIVGLKGDSPALDLTANVENVSLPAVLSAVGRQDIALAGTLSANAKVGGTARNPDADATLKLQQESGFLEASGSFTLESKAYRLEAMGKNLQFRGANWDLSAKGAGVIDDPNLDLTVNVSGLPVDGKTVAPLSAHLKVVNHAADVEAHAPDYRLSVNGRVGTEKPYPAQLEVRADGTDLSSLPVDLKQPLTGVITATIHGSGDLANWKEGSAQAHIAELNLKWKDQPIRAEGPLDARYANGALEVQPIAIVAAGSRVQLQGKLPGALAVQGDFDLARLLALAPEQPPLTAQGHARLDGTLQGTLQRLEPHVSLTLENGYLSDPQIGAPVTDILIRARLEDGTAEIEKLSARFGPATIEAHAAAPLPMLPGGKQGPVQLSLQVANFDLHSLKAMPEKVTGTISLRVDAQAPRLELTDLTAQASIDQLKLNVSGFQLDQPVPAVIRVQNGTAQIERFELKGPETDIRLAGTAGLTGSRPLDVQLNAKLDGAILAFFSDAFKARGPTVAQISVKGTAASPQVAGFVELRDVQASLPSPNIVTENLNLRLELSGDSLTIARFGGVLNGGALSAGGGLRYMGGELRDVNVKVEGKNIYLNYPEGVRTVSNVDLQLRSSADRLVLAGSTRILEGSYKEALTLEGGLLKFIQSGQNVELETEPNPFLSKLEFNIEVTTESPLEVDNNLAKAAIDLDVTLLGRYDRPGLTGRIEIEEGGQLNLRERKYIVDRGVITFTSEQRIEPSLDIQAKTQAAGYDITLQIQGDSKKLDTTLTSDPPLPEPDIIAVLLTGRKMEEARTAGVEIAKEQAFSYLAGSVGGGISRAAEQTLGLSQVRIEPNLIAAESDPSARLTIGQNITRKLTFVYSMNLVNSGDQIYIAEYDITRRFTSQAVRQNDNSYRLEFRHDLLFGGLPNTRRRSQDRLEKRKIGNVTFNGNKFFPDEQLAGRFKVKAGQTYDFFKVRKGMDRLEGFYAKNDLLEARVRIDREIKPSIVNLSMELDSGPKVEFVYEGWDVPGGVKDKVRKIWQSGVFDTQRGGDAVQAIRAALVEDGHLRSTVEYSIALHREGRKRVLFEIQPGVRYRNVELVFEGTSGIPPEELKVLLHKQKLENAVYAKPGEVKDFLSRYYRERGYLDAQVQDPRYELNAQTRSGRTVIPIVEGPAYTLAKLEFTGNTVYDADRLRETVGLSKGETYRPRLRDQAAAKLQDLYGGKGYNDVEVTSTLQRDSAASTVDLIFHISENRQSIVKEIHVTGNDQTRESLIRGQIVIKEGDVLDLDKLGRSRRNLYNTGAYALVDIGREPLEPAENGTSRQKLVRLNVKVQEVQPFEIRYGGFFDTDRGPGGIVDFTNRNTLGSARVLGMRTRYDSDLHEARLYFSQPLLRRFPVKSTATTFLRRELKEGFITDRLGFTVQQEARFREHYIWNYGYRLERAHTFDRVPDPLFPFDITLRVAPVTSTLSRETRDDLLDATRGSFASQALEFSPRLFGSQLHFVRYFGQYFRYIPLSEPVPIPLSKGVKKTRLVYAGAARIGLAGGLGGQDLILSERFFAGGGTTIRGFSQDHVGPLDARGDPQGGNALFILNNEVRFPGISIFDGAAFVDIGNVYPHISDFNPFKVRKSAGLGIRLRTPYLLLRLDYGVKLDRRPGEGFGKLFFSIGQAF